MSPANTTTPSSIPLEPATSAERSEQPRVLWDMSPAERVAAMWRGQLTMPQLRQWSSRAPHEVPLLSGELAWIVIRTPEWAEASDTCKAE